MQIRRINNLGKRILSIILCVVIFWEINLTARADNPKDICVSGYSLTVEDERLGMNVYFDGISDVDSTKAHVLMGSNSYALSKASNGYYKISFYVSPRDISTKYNIALYINNQKISLNNKGAVNGTINCSVKDYLSAIKSQDSAVGRLAQAIDDYGTCARCYFDGNINQNVSIKDIDDWSAYKSQITGTLPDGISYCGTSLIIKDTLSIRHYFSVDMNKLGDTLAYYSLQVNGEPVSYTAISDDICYVEINNISASDIDRTHSLVIDGPNHYEIRYSVLSYAYDAIRLNVEKELTNLVKSIYWYHQAFEECISENVHDDDFDDISQYKNSKYTENFGKAVIVIPTNATEEEFYAASMLQLAIMELDNYSPDIITDASLQESTGLREISVGNTNRPHGINGYTSEGSYYIKSYNGGISITGIGERGVIDGAVEFLRLCGGCYWLTWDAGMKSNQDCLKYSADIDYKYERAFSFTDVDVNYWQGIGGVNGKNRMYSLYYGLNGTFVNVQMDSQPGYQNWYLSRLDSYNGIHGGAYDYMQPGHAHTLLAEYFDENDLKEHPEWFVDPYKDMAWNQRQVCTSNPEVYARIKECVFEMLDNEDIYDSEAYMQIICLAQSDNGIICHCADCKAFRTAHYKDSSDYQNDNPDEANAALYLDLCNKISADIKQKGETEGKDYSNVYVDMLAYVSTKQPPVNMTIDDHVIIRFAPIERCYAHSLHESAGVNLDGDSYSRENGCYECNEMAIYLQGWSELVNSNPGSQLWIWEYTVNFRDTYAPFPNIYSLIDDIRYYKELGVSGIYLQNTDRMNKLNTEYNDLRIYILSELLRNPNADVDKELKFFAHEYYGDGGEDMLEILDILTTQARRHNVGANACYPDFYPSWVGKIYFNNIVYRDHGMTFLAPVSRIYNNNYPVEMDAHNGMTDAEIATVDSLYSKALSATMCDAYANYNIRRTQLGWRTVKSVMHKSEFADNSTYLQNNQELYHDIFDSDKFGMTAFSLIYTGVPRSSDSVLQKSPDKWLSY